MQIRKETLTVIGKLFLTLEQKQKVWDLGTARNAAKPDGIRQTDSGYHSHNADRAHPHRLGIAAEIAYAVIAKKPLDERIMSSGDISDFDGIEIKASTWMGDDIELKVKKSEYAKKSPICYVLARVPEDLSFVEFMGCVSRVRFDKENYSKKHKFVENLCMEAKDLNKSIPIKNGEIIHLFPINKIKIHYTWQELEGLW
jgi:hypothetical protein